MRVAYRFCLPAVLAASITQASVLQWNNGQGNLLWDSSSTNWSGVTWNSATPDSAVFGPSGAGTISLAEPITAAALTFNAGGYALQGNTLTLAGVRTVTVTGGVSAQVSSGLAGTAGLTKAGAGTLSLSGAGITYQGATTIDGRLVLDDAAVSIHNSSNISINAGAVMELNVTGTLTDNGYAKTYTGSGVLLKTGSGALRVGYKGGTMDHRVSLSAGGAMDVQAGDLNIGWVTNSFSAHYGGLNVAEGASFHCSQVGGILCDWLTGTGRINNAYNSTTPTFTFGIAGTTNSATYGVSSNTAVFAGVIGYAETYNSVSVGTLNVVKAGGGTQVLTGTNGWTGTTTISGGTLEIGGAGKLGGGSYAGAIANNARLLYSSSAPQTFGGVISGTGTLVKTGSGTLTLTAANTLSGATTVSSGALVLSGAAPTLQNTSVLTVSSNATLFLSGANNNQLDSANTASSWVINGTVTVTTATAHTLYPAAITLNGGTLSSTISPADWGTFFAGASKTITAYGPSNTISTASFGIAAGQTLTLNTPALTDRLLASTPFGIGTSGTAGSLAKTGAGTLILAGTNAYTGATIVNGGTVTVNGALSNTVITVTNATLNGSGTLYVRMGTGTPDLIQALGGSTIDLSGLHLSVVKVGMPSRAEYVLVSDRTLVTGTFASEALPPLFSVDYDGTPANPGAVVLVYDTASASKPWDGQDPSQGLWSAQANWNGDTLPLEEYALLFPAGQPWPENTNDLLGSVYSLSLQGGYTLRGNALAIGSGVSSEGTNTVALPLSLTGQKTFGVTGGLLGLSGAASGTGGVVKTGSGTLTLAADATYTGATVVSNGLLRLQAPATTVTNIPGLVLRLDANDVTGGGNPANGATVTSWTNLTGAGAFSGTGAQLNPTSYRMNGQPVVHFNGTLLTNSIALNSTPLTVLYVGRMTGGQNRRLLSGYAVNWLLGYHGGTQGDGYYNGWVFDSAQGVNYGANLYEAIIPGTGQNSSVYQNGILLGSNQGGVAAPGVLALGGNASEWSYCDVGELLVFTNALSETQRLQAEQYLQTKWQGVLPQVSAVNLATASSALDLNGVSQTLGSLAGVAGSRLTMNGGWLTVGTDNTTTTFAGVLAAGSDPSRGLTKVGNGDLVLSGPSSYTVTGEVVLASGRIGLGMTGGAFAVNGNFVGIHNASPDVYTTVDNQFAPGCVMYFQGSEGDHVRFELLGTTQTLAGIDNTGGRSGYGVIQMREQVTATNVGSVSTLVLNGSGNYLFSGYARDTGGSLRLVKSGMGTQTLSGANFTYAGATTVNGGLLVLSNTTAFASALDNSATVEFMSPTGANYGYGKAMSGSGTWNKTGPGTLQFNGGQAITASGQINIQAGMVMNNGNSVNWSLCRADVDVASGAVLDLYADPVTLDALTGAGTVRNTYGNTSAYSGVSSCTERLTLGTANGSGTFSGTITDTGNAVAGVGNGLLELVKIGTGTQTLTGSNTYHGLTLISLGTFKAANTNGSATGFGPVTVNTATLAGNGTVSGAVTVNDGGTVAPGDGVATLTVGSLTMAAGSLFRFEFNSSPSNDQIRVLNGDGLILNGGGVYLLTEGTQTSWSHTGTYNLIAYSGALGGTGLGALSVLNPHPGLTYTFGASGGWITLTISGGAGEWNGAGADDGWNTDANWVGGTRPSAGDTLGFGAVGAARLNSTNNMAANTRFGGIAFANDGAFTLNGNAVNLQGHVANNSTNAQSVNLPLVLDGAGRHYVSADAADIAITSGIGDVGGAGGLVKMGPATLALGGLSTYGGGTTIEEGVLKLTAGTNSIRGFGSVGSGWTLNGGAVITNDAAILTDGGGSQGRSVFYNARVAVTNTFTASFTYQAGGNRAADGAAFVLHNDPRGPAALGQNGGYLAYGGTGAILKSDATEFNLYASASGGIGTAHRTQGVVGPYTSTAPVNIASGNPIQVTLTYDPVALTLTEQLQEANTTNTATLVHTNVNIAATLGAETGFVGFTGGTGGSTAIQTFSNFVFTTVGSMSSLPVTGALYVASQGTLDLNGAAQTVESLNDFSGSAGVVTNTSGSPASLTAVSSGSAVFSGVLAGSGANAVAFMKSGSGMPTLSGNNTYSGGTTVHSGSLQVGAGATSGTLGSGPVTVASGATLRLNRSDAFSFSNAMNGAGNVYKLGANGPTYGGTSTVSGSMTIQNGSFSVASGASMSGLSRIQQDAANGTYGTWNVSGILSATEFYGAYGSGNWGNSSATLNVYTGGVAVIGTARMSRNGWNQASSTTTTINNSGDLTVTSMVSQGQDFGGVGNPVLNNYINVNTGGRLSATTIDLSYVGSGGATFNRLLTLNGGTLANITNGNLTVDATTLVALGAANGTVEATAGRTATINSIVQGAGNLIKAGAGTLSLVAANTYSGATVVANGTLLLSGAGRLGTGLYSGAITNNGVFLYSSATNQTLAGPIAGTGTLMQTTGTLTLGGTNTYSGATLVNAGRLLVTGSLGAASAVSVAAGAILAGSGAIAGPVTLADNATLEGGVSGVGTLTLADLTATGTAIVQGYLSTSACFVVTGSVTGADGSLIVTPLAVPASGTYPFVRYTGANPFSRFRFALPSRIYSLVDNTAAQSVDVAVNTGAFPIWTGAFSGEWSTNTLSAPKNWTLNLGGATDFLPLDFVRFDDSATGTTTVALSGANITPSLASFENSALPYILSGSSGVTAAPLVKSGMGTLTIANTNSFTSVTVSNGVLAVASSAAIGAAASNTIVMAGGELAGGAAVTLPNTLRVAGSFTINGMDGLTLAGPFETGSSAGNTLTISNAVTITGVVGGTAALTKSGAGTLTLTAFNTCTGGTVANEGAVLLGYATGGNGTIRGTLTVNPGAVVDYAIANPFGWNAGASVNVLNINGGTVGSAPNGNHFWNSFQLTMTGGTLNLGGTLNEFHNPTITVNSSPATAQILRAGALAEMRLRDGTSATLTVADGAQPVDLLIVPPITYNSGTSSIIKNGAGTLALAGACTYNGTTTINGGALWINGSKNGGGGVTVNAGASLGGSGVVAGVVSVAATAHIAPGAEAPATLTLTSGLTLSNGAVLDFDLGTASDQLRITGGTFTGAGAGGVTIRISDSGGLTCREYVLADWTGASAVGVDPSDFVAVIPPSFQAKAILALRGSQLVLSLFHGGLLILR